MGLGFDIAVIDAARDARFLRGELLYKVTALQQLFRFPGFDFALTSGSGTHREGHHLMLTVSNGRFFGGGFPIAPGATITPRNLSDDPNYAQVWGGVTPIGAANEAAPGKVRR